MLQFLNPALLFGAALFAVPLIIHLLNRHRYKRRVWAAMDFLLRAYKKQRRRLRRENLLLLLLRCLIPIVLALAIARPQLSDASGVGGMSGAAHHVVVLDHSYSMGLQLPGSTTPFERAKVMASNLIDRVAGRGNQKLTLVLSGVRPTVPIRDEIDLERSKARIASLRPPVDAGTPLTEALLEVADLVEEATEPDLRVYLFTDLQVRAFGEDPFAAERPPAGPATARPTDEPTAEPTAEMFEDTAEDAVRRIREKAELIVFDVRSQTGTGGREDNLQVVDLALGVPHAIAKVPVPVVARLVNRTTQSQALLVTLEIDGGQPIRKPLQLEAGAEGEVEFETAFRDTGQRRLAVSVEGDGLAADNRRFAVVPVRDRLRLLLVEGTAEDDPSLRETTHLVEVLDPTRGAGSPDLTTFAPKVVDTISFLSGRERLLDYDLIVLANLSHLDERTAESLLAAVQAGTGLLVLFGDETDTENFNILLHRAGEGPMPMRLLGELGYPPGGDSYYGIRIEKPEHAIFGDIDRDVYRQIFENLPVYRYFGTDFPRRDARGGDARGGDADHAAAGDFEILATVRDQDLSPLFVASSWGNGRVLFATSPINRRPDPWNELHSTSVGAISFLLLHPLAYWLALPTTDPHNVEVGGGLTTTVPEKPTNLAVVLPERAGQGKVPIGEEARPLLGDRYALPPFRRTHYAGIYEVEMLFEQSGASRRESEFFAVNPVVEEGDLSYYSHQMAQERYGFDRIRTDLPAAGRTTLQSGFSDLGVPLLALLLLLLAGEAALARWVSRRRA